MHKESQWKQRQNSGHNGGSKPMDLSMLNEHGRKINAQAEKLQRDRQNLMQQRTETGNQNFTRSKESRQNPQYGNTDNFNRQYEGGDRNRRRGVPETIPEESSRRHTQTEAVERVENVKGLIDQLVQDSKIESGEVKQRLRNIQQKQQQLLNDLENYSPKINEGRSTGLYEARPPKYVINLEQVRPLSEYQASSRPNGEGRKTYNYKEEVAEFALDSHNDEDGMNVLIGSDPLSGLSALQGRISEQIMTLREKNIKLMKGLNAETKNFNELLSDYKVLEEQNSKLKDHLATIASELNSIRFDGARGLNPQRAHAQNQRVTHITPYNAPGASYSEEQAEQNQYLTRELEKLQKDNQGLREKMRKKSTFGSRQSAAGDGQYQDLKDENSRLKQALRTVKADAEKLEQQLSHRERAQTINVDDEKLSRQAHLISDLKDQLSQSQQDISRLRSENRRLEDKLNRGGGDVQIQLDDLKMENDRLRKETIDLLKAAGSGSNRHRDNDRIKASQGLSYNSYQHSLF